VQAAELERYLHEHIPLSRAMAVAVLSASEATVVLQAPLAPNINQRETVFGGSASALGILAAWSLLHVRLRAEGIASRVVIQRNTMEYERPITGEFTARSLLDEPDRWPRFTRMLARMGRARITVSSVLEHSGRVAGRLSGEFVAFGAEGG
jgi:thioesterase domain-containing protein